MHVRDMAAGHVRARRSTPRTCIYRGRRHEQAQHTPTGGAATLEGRHGNAPAARTDDASRPGPADHAPGAPLEGATHPQDQGGARADGRLLPGSGDLRTLEGGTERDAEGAPD